MNELLEQLRWLLSIPVTATVDEVISELQKAIDQLKGSNPAIEVWEASDVPITQRPARD